MKAVRQPADGKGFTGAGGMGDEVFFADIALCGKMAQGILCLVVLVFVFLFDGLVNQTVFAFMSSGSFGGMDVAAWMKKSVKKSNKKM